jgi:hypothetical protein
VTATLELEIEDEFVVDGSATNDSVWVAFARPELE